MDLKSTLLESSSNSCHYILRLPPAPAMQQSIVSIPAKRYPGQNASSPGVKRIMQEQVGQKGTDYPALRRAHIPLNKLAVVVLQRRFQPTLHIEQHPADLAVMTQRLHQERMINIGSGVQGSGVRSSFFTSVRNEDLTPIL